MKKLREIETAVDDILSTSWKSRKGQAVPETENVQMGNDAVELEGTVLYADLADSTGLVLGYKDWFAAEIYKIYLLASCEMIRNNGGIITAFDGDRVMAVFIGDNKNTAAAKCALQIDYLVTKVLNPKIQSKYPNTGYKLKQSVGIDTSPLFVARTGVRGSNDLVWVGRAANYAAKLCCLRDGLFTSFITAEVYNMLADSAKNGGDPKRPMWQKVMWAEMGIAVYKSSWHWKPD